jgi:nicotinamide mononucleotide adenylyltransferase
VSTGYGYMGGGEAALASMLQACSVLAVVNIDAGSRQRVCRADRPGADGDEQGFYIGRFQPYHNGHQSVLERIACSADEIVIGTGAPRFPIPCRTLSRPGTGAEAHPGARDLDCPFYVIPIEDVQRNALWVAHVRAMTPPFDMVYSSNLSSCSSSQRPGSTSSRPTCTNG